MNTSINYFLFFFLTAFLSGCVTKTVKEGSFNQAQWETKALVKNLKEKKNQTLNIDIFAIKDEKARFEISAMMGFQVASLTMSAREISYAIYPQKAFYYGQNSERAFAQILGMPLHPMNLTNIAFDQPVRGPGWKCQQEGGVVSQCENASKNISVIWKERNEGAKKVQITSPQFEMQWHFNTPKTEVQFKPDLFTLTQPKGFKAIEIN